MNIYARKPNIVQVLQKLLLIAIVFVLSSCAAFVPKEHLIPKERLVSTLQKQFPLQREKGNGLFSITIGTPQLSLIQEQNRIRLDGGFIANAVSFELDGAFVFSSELRYNSGQRAIYLQEASIDSGEFRNEVQFGVTRVRWAGCGSIHAFLTSQSKLHK